MAGPGGEAPWLICMTLLILIAFAFGTFIGSFLNVCVHRMPRNESIVLPPSRCYACGTQLTWYDNLPVLGWLLVWGRCRWCGTAFSPRYLIAELVVGGLTALVTWWVVTHPTPWTQVHDVAALVGALAAGLALVWMLYVAAMIDLEHTIIPDELTKSFQLVAPFLAVASATGIRIEEPFPAQWLMQMDVFGGATPQPGRMLAWMGGITGVVILLLLVSVPLARVIYSRFTQEAPWTEDDHRGFRLGVWWFSACTAVQLAVLAGLLVIQPGTWWVLAAVLLAQGILGSIVGWGSLYTVGFLGTVAFRRNAMGFGDVKFLAPIGAFLGPLGIIYAFFAAAIVGAAIGIPLRLMKNQREIPFGPYLAIGALLVVVWGGDLHRRLLTGIW